MNQSRRATLAGLCALAAIGPSAALAQRVAKVAVEMVNPGLGMGLTGAALAPMTGGLRAGFSLGNLAPSGGELSISRADSLGLSLSQAALAPQAPALGLHSNLDLPAYNLFPAAGIHSDGSGPGPSNAEKKVVYIKDFKTKDGITRHYEEPAKVIPLFGNRRRRASLRDGGAFDGTDSRRLPPQGDETFWAGREHDPMSPHKPHRPPDK